MAEYRIDELAQAADATVRNVRAYQERGLLPPPRRRGRVGIYEDTHLARLQLIGRLLDRGYTVANIGELLTAWEHGRDLSEVLGLEQMVVSSFFAHGLPETVDRDELAELLTAAGDDGPPDDHDVVARAIEVGLVVARRDDVRAPPRYSVPNPRLLRAIAELIAVGFPAPEVFALCARIQRGADDTARHFAAGLADHVFAGRAADWMPAPEEIAGLTDFIHRIRNATTDAVHAALAGALDRHVDDVLGDYAERLSTHLSTGRTVGPAQARPATGS